MDDCLSLFYNNYGGSMYFDSILVNFVLMIGLIVIVTLVNYFLNRHARLLMKYTYSLKMQPKDIVKNYAFNQDINVTSYASKGGNDLDNYIDSNKSIFMNARHYYSNSIYSLSRVVYLCSMSKVAKENYKKYKLQSKSDSIFMMLEVLAWGLIFIGLLLKINLLMIIGLIIIVLSFIFVFINYKTIRKYHEESLVYLNKILKDKKEINVIKVIYSFERYQYILKPILSMIKLFPFLLSSNQKKVIINDYE